VERTLVIVKPDAVQRGLIGEILRRFEARGLRIVAMKMMWIDRRLAEQHYEVHRGKPFFPGLIGYITSAPVVVAVLEGSRAVQIVRATMGATDPLAAGPGTIRGDLAVEIGRNLVHGSDSPETAQREIALFFRPEEILRYQRDFDPWIYEPGREI
jgi:nucleoside-diphosphate kinase